MARPFKICPDCGAHLDASEPCDCKDAIEREPPKPWERLKLLAVCREVDKESGRVSGPLRRSHGGYPETPHGEPG